LGEPVYLAVPGKNAPTLLRIDSGKAVETRIVPDPTAQKHFLVRATVGGGWASTGDWLLQNIEGGAPVSRSTVNAFSPAFSLDVEGRPLSWLSLGLGTDLQVPVGDWHSLPIGDSSIRLLAYPYFAAGVPFLQATVGPMLPWHLGVGAKTHLPVTKGFEISGSALYGIGIPRPREGTEDFEPLPLWSAWAGVSYSFGK